MPHQYTGTGTCASARPRTTGTRQQRTGTRQQFSHLTHAAARSSRINTSSRTCARASSAARSSAPSAATQRQVADPSALHTAHRARVASLRSRHLALPVEAAALGSARLVAFTIQKKSAVQPPSTRLASAPRNAGASVAAQEQRARRLRMARDGALFFESQEGRAMFMHLYTLQQRQTHQR